MSLICPVVLKLSSTRHDGTGLVCAELTNSAIDDVDAVEEIDNVECDPVNEVHIFRKFDSRVQT